MREFAVYTLLRLGLLLATCAVVAGIWALVSREGVPLLPVLVIGILGSGVASYFLLRRQREAFALRVQRRAERASARFEEMRAREDDDAEA